MRILISHDGSPAHYFIRLGFARAFEASGHNVLFYEQNSKPIFDVFQEFRPDILFTQAYNIDRATFKCIKNNPHIKVICKTSDWGPINDNIDTKQFPIKIADENEIRTLEQLKKETGQPEFGFIHYHSSHLDDTHGHWKDVGIDIKSLMSAADVFDYTHGEFKEEYSSDIAFVGGRWPYKGITLSKWIDPLLYPIGKYNIKIGGNGWGCPQSMGRLPPGVAKHFLASTTIGINVHEPHSQEFGIDVIERVYKLASNKVFCITDYVQSLVDNVFDEDEMVSAKTPDEFEELIQHYLKYPDERLPYIDKAYKRAVEEHTYFNRVADIFDNLGMEFEKNKTMRAYENVKKDLSL